jgi:hypothetical protein
MLQPAYLYKDELYKYKCKFALDERYKYFDCSSSMSFTIDTDDSSWNKIQLVSIDKDNNPVGYFQANIDRAAYNVSSLKIANLTPTANFTFAKDLQQFFLDLFNKYNFNKINFVVVIGNPAEAMYDKLVSNYGGRVVGVYKNDQKLWDGQIYDLKAYEILKEEFCIFGYKDKIIN